MLGIINKNNAFSLGYLRVLSTKLISYQTYIQMRH